jgi:hypothetical protein
VGDERCGGDGDRWGVRLSTTQPETHRCCFPFKRGHTSPWPGGENGWGGGWGGGVVYGATAANLCHSASII